MQIKKSEVREAILKEGEREFLANGFLNASLRKIVKKAGTTIGNFYNYFPNKESLFEQLVKDEYEKLRDFIENHDKIERPDYLWEISDITQWRRVLKQLIINTFPYLTPKFVLLIEGSKGTKYENVEEEIITLLKDHFLEHMERFSDNHLDQTFAEIIAEQLLNGIILILKKYPNPDQQKEFLSEHLLFYFIGFMGILGNWE